MRLPRLTTAAILVTVSLFALAPLRAADDLIDKLATCQASWLDFKDDPVQTTKFGESFQAAFERKGNDGSWVPKKPTLAVGLPVVRAYPESLGMGVGFSVVVDAPFDKTRAQVEKTIGKKLKDCETSDGMRTCGLELAAKRTVSLMAGDNGKSKQTLLGCYYFYAK